MSYWGATVITNLLSAMSVLPTIGNVNVHALKKEIKYD
jgi:quinol-cytochrome oxidoreductase complex cytochrome b subunit